MYIAINNIKDDSLRLYQGGMFIGAAVANIAVAPWTILVMGKTNGRLHELANKASARETEKEVLSKAEAGELGPLLDRWVVLNYIRCSMPLLGCLIGVLAPGADFWYR